MGDEHCFFPLRPLPLDQCVEGLAYLKGNANDGKLRKEYSSTNLVIYEIAEHSIFIREKYFLHNHLHKFDRQNLEGLLGIVFTQCMVEKDISISISYRSHWLWFYFSSEVIVLAAFLCTSYLIIQKVESFLLIPVFLSLPMVLISTFVIFIYSPAWFDFDLFYQRIFLEIFTLYCLLILGNGGFLLLIVLLSVYFLKLLLYKLIKNT
ncbi:MAG: hypothetical protein DWQ05_14620 [Calditrichaeota bacterium]|nr:MAG: hypothetical protein DWQ05_14620 [Calditrichota bacterium]